LPGLERLAPIGRPIRNVRTYVLDEHRQPVPIGVPGELYVAGSSLARGYRNRDELTAERFVPDPFGAPGERMYRTGDVVRWLSDGQIEFLGRDDDQVKLRGFRIELGEIEAALIAHPDVSEVAVSAREDVSGDKRLVAYIVARAAKRPEISALQDFLRERLPSYMVPPAFVVLEALPLNANGKVDRGALPAPDWESAIDYVAPRTELEELVADIFKDVLRVERIGVHDNFFGLGGHSLMATQVLLRIQRSLGLDIPLTAVFQGPSVAQLAVHIETLQWALQDSTQDAGHFVEELI
jgi:acyl carrier protein